VKVAEESLATLFGALCSYFHRYCAICQSQQSFICVCLHSWGQVSLFLRPLLC